MPREESIRRDRGALALILAVAGCSGQPKSDQALAAEAQQAVDKKFDTRGQFSLMESVVSQDIACGHFAAADQQGRGQIDQDFVYQRRRLIMDDDPDFDQAAIECDVAAAGGNTQDSK
jgi:hypothetical protein